MASTSDRIGEFAEQTSEQARHIGQAAADVAGQAHERIMEAVETGASEGRRIYSRAGAKARELKDLGVEQYEVVRGQMQRNVLTTTLIAFAVGFVLSRVVFRR